MPQSMIPEEAFVDSLLRLDPDIKVSDGITTLAEMQEVGGYCFYTR